MMPARTTWYYLKEFLKEQYLHTEARVFYDYHRTVVEKFVESDKRKKPLLKRINNYELLERLTVGGTKTAFHGLGMSMAIDSSLNNTNGGMLGCIISIVAGLVVSDGIKRYYKRTDRREVEYRSNQILYSEPQDKIISKLINQPYRPPKPEKGYLEREKDRYDDSNADSSGEDWKK